jgi:putative tryptophan/tyrosine transport system substrate-binding protein
MKVVSSKTVSGSYSDNRKSAIQNPKWVGLALVIALTFALGAAVAQVQQPGKIPRIGYLAGASPSAIAFRIEAFRQGLRELGYVEGKNIAIEYRYAEGNFHRQKELATELARLNVDVIVTSGPASTRSAKETTSTIPIVMTFDSDPVGSGSIASLARPGANITGLSTVAPEISGKQLELLKESVPKLSRVAVLGSSANPGNARVLAEMEAVAQAFSVKLQYRDILAAKEIEEAFRTVSNKRADAVVVLAGTIIIAQRTRIAEMSLKSRLPSIYERREFVEAGGLMSYGISIIDLDRRAATYVDKILKGTKPADLPVEQPKKFEFVINLKTAKQIGLTIPPNVLARADKVIK